MAPPSPVDPVKWIVAILWCHRDSLQQALDRLTAEWGGTDHCGPDHPFDVTSYYDQEMGAGLHRRLIGFERLQPPESLPQAKLWCNRIEDELSRDHTRPVNLDVGYLDHNKIVLASAKYAGQKIHIGQGIYADLIARFKQGRYHAFEWTFPDFRDGRYDAELVQIRETYLRQLRARRGKGQ